MSRGGFVARCCLGAAVGAGLVIGCSSASLAQIVDPGTGVGHLVSPSEAAARSATGGCGGNIIDGGTGCGALAPEQQGGAVAGAVTQPAARDGGAVLRQLAPSVQIVVHPAAAPRLEVPAVAIAPMATGAAKDSLKGGKSATPAAAAAQRDKGMKEIVDPGTGVGAAARIREITDPGTGTGASAPAGVQIILNTPAAGLVPADQPSPAAAPALPLGGGVTPMNFADLDSGLRDCDIPFDELATKSPFCRGAALTEGRQCQRFSYSQFPEVVKITVAAADGSSEICSGTVVAADWVITAAHCFIGNGEATADETGSAAKDFVWTPGGAANRFSAVAVEALNAKMLGLANRRRWANRIVVFGKYGGQRSTPQFTNDLALVHLDTPYPAEAVQPAVIATDKDISAATTIAGYGYSNADSGTLGRFNVTWPVPVTRDAEQLSFNPQAGGVIRAGFCQGDSGGPVYAGRYRGCKPADIVPEDRPRLLEGTISYNFLGTPDATGSDAQQAGSACRNGYGMVMQDITVADRRRWICKTTNNVAGGCKEASR